MRLSKLYMPNWAWTMAATLRRLVLPSADAPTTYPFPHLTMLDLSQLSRQDLSASCTHDRDVKPYRVMPPTLAESLVNILKARRDATGVTIRVYLREWTGRWLQFEQSVLETARNIPGVEFLPEGSLAPCDG